MSNSLRLTVITLLLAVSNLSAATLYVSPGSTNPTPPYASWATAATNIQDAVDAAALGTGVVLVTNGVYAGGVSVTKPLTLLGVSGPQYTVIKCSRNQQCIALTNGASLTGFTLTNGWATFGGGVSCTGTNAFLTNCTLSGNGAYSGGGAYGCTLYNCTLTGNNAEGGGAACCCTLYNCMLTSNSVWGVTGLGGGAASSVLYNCTLTDNSAFCGFFGSHGGHGGGAFESTLYNCSLSRNLAWGDEGHGGGAYASTLYNCTLTGNSAGAYGGAYGGGVSGGTLYNCTLTGNSADYGGGASANLGSPSKLYNCIAYFNTATIGTNYDTNSILNYCCTMPLPTNGVGNITNAPLFVDYTNGNLRLQSNSPCINAGNNAYVTTTTDLDGRPRIVGGTVDMGAYEFQPGVSGAFIGWLQQYGLPTDGSADFADADGDAMNNWQEWICGTDPTNRLSALRLLSVAPAETNATVRWQSVAGVHYFLEWSANLASPFTFVATNILGQAGTTSYADTNATGAGPFFYRVGVNSP